MGRFQKYPNLEDDYRITYADGRVRHHMSARDGVPALWDTEGATKLERLRTVYEVVWEREAHSEANDDGTV